MIRSRIAALTTVAALFLSGGIACDASGDFLFPGEIEGVPGVLHIESEGGGPIVPADVVTLADVQANTIYAEVGPTGDVLPGGITVEFEGTGGTVCAFVDPEMVAWNTSVSTQSPIPRWTEPDNIYDDGDADMRVGLSLYYRGTYGETMGGFEVDYQDDLGNEVEVELVACNNEADVGGNFNPEAHAGRGTVEYCSIENTQPGVRYTVAMQAFGLPRDDNRLGLGFLIVNGPCSGNSAGEDGNPVGLINRIAPTTSQLPLNEECVITGEGLKPIDVTDGQLYYGYEEGRTWAGSEAFEEHFCNRPINTFCVEEQETKLAEGVTCERVAVDETMETERCFCGDRNELPDAGAAEF